MYQLRVHVELYIKQNQQDLTMLIFVQIAIHSSRAKISTLTQQGA